MFNLFTATSHRLTGRKTPAYLLTLQPMKTFLFVGGSEFMIVKLDLSSLVLQ